MGLPMDHMPTGGMPCVLPVAFHCWLPFLGLRTMPNIEGAIGSLCLGVRSCRELHSITFVPHSPFLSISWFLVSDFHCLL